MNNPYPLRGRPGSSGPWCWQEKKVRRLIRERMDGSSLCVYVLTVYDALTEIASDEQKHSFTTLQSYIANRAACSVPQTKRALAELKAIGAVTVKTPRLKGPCTYSLMALNDPSIASSEPTLAPIDTAKAPNGNDAPGATVEESEKNLSVEKLKNLSIPAAKLKTGVNRSIGARDRTLKAGQTW